MQWPYGHGWYGIGGGSGGQCQHSINIILDGMMVVDMVLVGIIIAVVDIAVDLVLVLVFTLMRMVILLVLVT